MSRYTPTTFGSHEPGRPALLPLSPAGAAVCREALAALDDPARRAASIQAGSLPRMVVQALCLLDDPEIEPAAAAIRRPASMPAPDAGLRSERKARLRALFQVLGSRHPEALAGILAAMGAPSSLGGGEEGTIVVHAYAWLIVITIGGDARYDHPMADLEPG